MPCSRARKQYDNSGFGAIECAFGIVATLGTGATRMIADRHWHSDVVAGIGLGGISGYLLPMLLHYGWTDSGPPLAPTIGSGQRKARTVLLPMAGEGMPGIGWAGIF